METQTVKFTMAESRRNSALRCKRRIMWLLHIEEAEYFAYQFETGMQYLEAYLYGNNEDVLRIASSSVFWSWWKNQWTLREELYMAEAEHLSKVHINYRYAAYDALHNPKTLAAEIHPNAIVLGDSYEKMIQELIKTEA